MKTRILLEVAALSIAAAFVCCPPLASAASPTDSRLAILDVRLEEGGVLAGQVVDPQGLPKADIPVVLLVDNRQVGASATDGQGRFFFRGLNGGVYQLTTPEGLGMYRVWAPGTAPPSARPAVLVVDGGPVVRGSLLASPAMIVGLGAASIAVPAVVQNSGGGRPASPP